METPERGYVAVAFKKNTKAESLLETQPLLKKTGENRGESWNEWPLFVSRFKFILKSGFCPLFSEWNPRAAGIWMIHIPTACGCRSIPDCQKTKNEIGGNPWEPSTEFLLTALSPASVDTGFSFNMKDFSKKNHGSPGRIRTSDDGVKVRCLTDLATGPYLRELSFNLNKK